MCKTIHLTRIQVEAIIASIMGFMPENIPYTGRLASDRAALDIVAYLKAMLASNAPSVTAKD